MGKGLATPMVFWYMEMGSGYEDFIKGHKPTCTQNRKSYPELWNDSDLGTLIEETLYNVAISAIERALHKIYVPHPIHWIMFMINSR